MIAKKRIPWKYTGGAALAVFTYDDVVHKVHEGGEFEEYLQVCPNVIFELDWFYAKLGRESYDY